MQGDAVTYIPFDTEVYDYGDNYNTSSGIYTVPYNGSYLIHVRVQGWGLNSVHNIMVDGHALIHTWAYDPGSWQTSSTSIVLHLVVAQELAVEPYSSGTIGGWDHMMYTTFGVTLIHPD